MKLKSKSFILGMAVVQTLGVTQFARAEVGMIVGTPVSSGGNTNIVNTSGAGVHDINQTMENASQIYSQIIATNQINQAADREYLDQVNAKTQSFFKQMTSLVYTDLTNLSVGVAPGMVDSAEILKSRAQFKKLRIELESSLSAFNAVTKGALPSQTEVAVKGTPTQTTQMRNIDMTNLVTAYTQALTGLESAVNELQFSVVMNGNPEIIKGNLLNFKFKSPLMSQKEVDKLRADAVKLMAPDSELKDQLFEFNRSIVKSISAFIDKYGKSEDWRFMSKEDAARRDDQLKLITEGFWARSYLRAKFGIKLGTFNPVDFKKGKLNISDWFKNRDELTAMREEQAYSNDDLIKAMSNIQEVVNIFSTRAVDFKNSNEPILARAYAFAHWATGGSTASEAILMMETLMAADILEEQIITNQSREDLVAFYKSRYQGNQERTEHYKKLKCDWDRTASGCEGVSVSTSIGADSTDKSTIRGHFNILGQAKISSYIGKLTQGKEMLKQADLAQESLAGEFMQGIKKNTEEL